jgi:hypothetical protein
MLGADVPDQLHHDDCLPHAGAAEEGDLSSAREGREQIDRLQAGLQDARHGFEFCVGRGCLVDALNARGRETAFVDRLPQHVEEPSQRLNAHWHTDRAPGVEDPRSPRQSIGRVQRDRPRDASPHQLYHLQRQARHGVTNSQQVVDRW